MGGPQFVCPLGGVLTWHRAVERLVSISYCVIYILPLLLSYKYDDIVSYCDKQHLYVFIILLVANLGWDLLLEKTTFLLEPA